MEPLDPIVPTLEGWKPPVLLSTMTKPIAPKNAFKGTPLFQACIVSMDTDENGDPKEVHRNVLVKAVDMAEACKKVSATLAYDEQLWTVSYHRQMTYIE
jgi:hypothetical protein